jgi:hypothetical protein
MCPRVMALAARCNVLTRHDAATVAERVSICASSALYLLALRAHRHTSTLRGCARFEAGGVAEHIALDLASSQCARIEQPCAIPALRCMHPCEKKWSSVSAACSRQTAPSRCRCRRAVLCSFAGSTLADGVAARDFNPIAQQIQGDDVRNPGPAWTLQQRQRQVWRSALCAVP